MTGQCDFLRKFPNFLRKQGVSAFSVYPPHSLSACQSHFPAPSIISQPFVQFQSNQGKRSHGYDSPMGSGRKQLSSEETPKLLLPALPQKAQLGSISTTTYPPRPQPHGQCQLYLGLSLTQKREGGVGKQKIQRGPERTCWWQAGFKLCGNCSLQPCSSKDLPLPCYRDNKARETAVLRGFLFTILTMQHNTGCFRRNQWF